MFDENGIDLLRGYSRVSLAISFVFIMSIMPILIKISSLRLDEIDLIHVALFSIFPILLVIRIILGYKFIKQEKTNSNIFAWYLINMSIILNEPKGELRTFLDLDDIQKMINVKEILDLYNTKNIIDKNVLKAILHTEYIQLIQIIIKFLFIVGVIFLIEVLLAGSFPEFSIWEKVLLITIPFILSSFSLLIKNAAKRSINKYYRKNHDFI
ncbi:MAG: hypothetical protein ACOCP4_02915 [Candidatus Woesearchaeota archaeon]